MMMALAFALFLFSVVALVADGAELYVWSARVQAAAQTAAQAGANSVDPQFLYGSSDHLVDLDVTGGLMSFERSCVQVGDQSGELSDPNGNLKTADSDQSNGEGVRCVSDGCRVFASVEKVVALPIPLFGATVRVRGVYFAAPVVGASAAAVSHCVTRAWARSAPPNVP